MSYSKTKTVLLRMLALNWLVALAKILVGSFAGSIAIISDGCHSFFDGFSNILGLVGIKMAQKPQDPSHPYGHRKFEALAALGIIFMVGIASYEFLRDAVSRIFHPTLPEITALSFGIIGGCLLIDIFVWGYEQFWGEKLKSLILVTDAFHTKTHFFTTPAILAGMVAMKFGIILVDPLLTFFVVSFIIRLAWETAKESTGILSDRARVEVKAVQEIANRFNQIKSVHQIRTRGDIHYTFLDMHICLNPNLSLKEAHDVSAKLKDRIMAEIPQIKDAIIHIEPWGEEC